MLLATQPLPRGRRVGIVTNAGGPGILASDACEDNGLTIPQLQPETVSALKAFLPQEASFRNPVDMIASASAENYRRSVEVLLKDDNIDSLLVIFVPPLMLGAREVADAIATAAQNAEKPLVSCFMGAHGFATGLGAEGEGQVQIPSYRFPEAAAKALSRAANYGEWRKVDKRPLKHFEVERPTEFSLDADGWLSPDDVESLLRAYGIATPKSVTASTVDDAVSAANAMGYPVALKLVADELTHKSDIGGVVLDRRDEEEVREAYADLLGKANAANIADQVGGVLVQQFVEGGVEAVIGVALDPSFGPLIMFGLGGTYVELFQDVAFRLHPLTAWDAEEMIWSVRTAELLRGYRGAPAADVGALKQLLAQVNQLVTDFPQLLEMDLNPVKILETGKGLMVVDARIRFST
jgi:acetyltransferase